MRSSLFISSLAAAIGIAMIGLTVPFPGASSATAAPGTGEGAELATEVVFGDEFAFSIEAPAGWSFAAPEAGRAGARCTPTAAAVGDAGPTITAEAPATPKGGKPRTSRELTDAETTTARAAHPATRVRYGDPIEMAGQSVVVAKYTPAENDAGVPWVTTAFIATKTGGVRVALSAPTRAAHDAAYQAFRNVVRSWRELPPAASH